MNEHIERTDKERQYSREWARKKYWSNPEESREKSRKSHRKYRAVELAYNKKYYQQMKDDPEYRKEARRRSLEYYHRNKDKHLARGKVLRAIKSGKIVKPTMCTNCQKQTKIEAHHDDHKKPLDVLWLCKQCHHNRHYYIRLAAIEKEKLTDSRA